MDSLGIYGDCDRQVYNMVLRARAGWCSPFSASSSPYHEAQRQAINSTNSQLSFLTNGGQNRTTSLSSPEN